MDLAILLIILGIVVGAFLSWTVGLIMVVVGIVLLLVPASRGWHPYR